MKVLKSDKLLIFHMMVGVTLIRIIKVSLFAMLLFVSTCYAEGYSLEVKHDSLEEYSEITCPSQNFAGFLDIFSRNIEVQQEFTRFSIEKSPFDVDGSAGSSEVARLLESAQEDFPIIPSADELKAYGLTLTIEKQDGYQAVVMLKNVSDKYKILYRFSKTSCWYLIRIESESMISAHAEPIVGAREALINNSVNKQKAAGCLRRGIFLQREAGLERRDDMSELFAEALSSFQCAAEAGSARAAQLAAALSLSGQAPRLSNDEIEELFIKAAEKYNDSAIGLADFYCNSGDSNYRDEPCDHPVEHKKWLVIAAKRGSSYAEAILGGAYEDGTYGEIDLPRAAACYQLAVFGGVEWAQKRLDKISAKIPYSSMSIYCY